jgi:putative nucleotidyltransferase with HDIG domain
MPSAVLALGSHRLLEKLHTHDCPTYEHSIAVGTYAEILARNLGFDDETIARVGEVGRLHDCGKCAIPLDILRYHGTLSVQGVLTMRSHVLIGHQLVLEDRELAPLAPAVRAHHERLDGHGYPDGLRGEAIPLEARLVAVADTFDALVRGRPYRKAIAQASVLTILHCGRSLQWQPEFVDSFIAYVERFGPLAPGAG